MNTTYTIHKRSEEEPVAVGLVATFYSKADAARNILAIEAEAKAKGEWTDGDYMTIRADGHILSYIPAKVVTKDEFGNSFTSPA